MLVYVALFTIDDVEGDEIDATLTVDSQASMVVCGPISVHPDRGRILVKLSFCKMDTAVDMDPDGPPQRFLHDEAVTFVAVCSSPERAANLRGHWRRQRVERVPCIELPLPA